MIIKRVRKETESNKMDNESGWFAKLVDFHREINRRVIYGGSPNYRLRLVSKKRKGLRTFLDKVDQFVLGALDWIDTLVLFKGRHIRARTHRGRSRKEREITEVLRKLGIKYRYEKSLKLGGKVLHPDFFLPQYNIYIEYWGLADSDSEYRAVMRAKQRLYSKHKVRVINVYPRDMKNIEDYLRKSIESLKG